MQPDVLAEVMMTLEPDVRDWYLSILATQHDGMSTSGDVLDSGSSRHLQSQICVTDSENLTPLAGFNGTTQWTEGSGYVTAYMEDGITGTSFKHGLKELIS